MLRAESISKSYGARVLFDRVDFTVGTRERVGLVGRNGHGKTTLFRMIAGRGGAGRRRRSSTPRNYRIGYVGSSWSFTEPTVLEEAMTACPRREQRRDSGGSRRSWPGSASPGRTSSGAPAELSGGYQVRLNLTKVLVADPTCCCWTSRPTTSTSPRSAGWSAS